VLIGLAAMGLCVYWLKVSWVAVWADAAYRLTASGPPSWLWPVIGSGVAVGIALAAFAMRGRRALGSAAPARSCGLTAQSPQWYKIGLLVTARHRW